MLQSLTMYHSRQAEHHDTCHHLAVIQMMCLSVAEGMAIWCTIRTYAAHAAELGNEAPPSAIFFVKPESCLNLGQPIDVTGHPGEVHHEVELVVRLDSDGRATAIGVGIDLTDRASQAVLRAGGLPWARGKCFRGSAVLGEMVDWPHGIESLSSPETGLRLELKVNGNTMQSAAISQMSISPAEQVSTLQEWAGLSEGDLLYTGTPSGVGQLFSGDMVLATLFDGENNPISQLDLRCY